MSPGLQHCKIKKSGGLHQVSCNYCDWTNDYSDPAVAQRMASNHIVKKHTDIAKPASQQAGEPKRPYTPRKQKSAVGVNFCPVCGTSLRAIQVAITI